MISKFSFISWFLVLCIFSIESGVAVPPINQHQRQRENSVKNQNYNVSDAVIKMASRIPLNATAGWKLLSFFQKHPRNLDVAFAVGPKKIIVKAPSHILSLASPVFEHELETRWENSLPGEKDEIPLPDFDPETFKLFVELTILDCWTVEALTTLELPEYQLLHLLSICRKYGMTTPLENLTELAKDFLNTTAATTAAVETKMENPVPAGSSTVSLAQVFPVVDTPFVCDGELQFAGFNMDIKIALKGLGFVGPIEADSFYQVRVQIWIYDSSKGNSEVTKHMEKRMFAQKSKTFYFICDQPVVLDPIPHDDWDKFYYIFFALTGPNTRSLKYEYAATKRINDGSKEFVISWESPQLVKIIYNTV